MLLNDKLWDKMLFEIDEREKKKHWHSKCYWSFWNNNTFDDDFLKEIGKKERGFLSNVEKKHFVWSHLEKDVMYIILKTKCVIWHWYDLQIEKELKNKNGNSENKQRTNRIDQGMDLNKETRI